MLTLLLSGSLFINAYLLQNDFDKESFVGQAHAVTEYNNDLCPKNSPPCW